MVADPVIGLFLEDIAHEKFITGLVQRIASEVDVHVEFDVRNATGGIPRMRGELQRFLTQCARAGTTPFDILVIAQDTDCRGESTIKSELDDVVQRARYTRSTIIAAPAPHIECWYLADPIAIQSVNRSSQLVAVPSSECEKDLYKRQLDEQFPFAPFGGIEYAADIVSAMNIYQAERNVSSLGRFLRELKSTLTILRDSSL